MHEMSIAEGILDIALDSARENDAAKITKVGLRIGEMAGIELKSLEMSWRMLIAGTMAEGAELAVEKVPLIGRCSKCGREYHIENYDFWCPECQDGVLVIQSGREMQVAYIDMD